MVLFSLVERFTQKEFHIFVEIGSYLNLFCTNGRKFPYFQLATTLIKHVLTKITNLFEKLVILLVYCPLNMKFPQMPFQNHTYVKSLLFIPHGMRAVVINRSVHT